MSSIGFYILYEIINNIQRPSKQKDICVIKVLPTNIFYMGSEFMLFFNLKKGNLFLVLAVIIFLLAGSTLFGYFKYISFTERQKVLTDKCNELQEKLNKHHKTNLDAVISDHIKNTIFIGYRQCDYKCEAHKILGLDEVDGNIHLYLYIYYEGFSGYQKTGGGAYPVLMVLKKVNGEYTVLSYTKPKPGTYYSPSIKSMFPSKYAELAINAHSNGISDELSEELKRQADDWFNILNSDTGLQTELIEPVKVIEKYFKFYNDKNREGVLSTLTPIYNTPSTILEFENLEYINLADVQEMKDQMYKKQYLSNGRGKVNGVKEENVKVYIVTYANKFKQDSIGPGDSGKHTKRFYLVRKNKNSLWLIDDISY